MFMKLNRHLSCSAMQNCADDATVVVVRNGFSCCDGATLSAESVARSFSPLWTLVAHVIPLHRTNLMTIWDFLSWAYLERKSYSSLHWPYRRSCLCLPKILCLNLVSQKLYKVIRLVVHWVGLTWFLSVLQLSAQFCLFWISDVNMAKVDGQMGKKVFITKISVNST